MHRFIAGLLVIGLSGCDVGDRAVRPPGEADGSSDQGKRDQGPKLNPPPPPQPPPPPPPKTGDTTTCVFLDSKSKSYCGVATSYPGPLAFDCYGVGSCSVKVTAPKGTELTWKSHCGGYAYSVVDGKPDTIGFDCGPGKSGPMEQVTCTFAGSTKKEACTTSGLPGPFRCSGIGSCKLWVLTTFGTKLTWTSTCAGSHQTVVGGGGGTLSFKCN